MKRSSLILIILVACSRHETGVQLANLPSFDYPKEPGNARVEEAPIRQKGSFQDVHEPGITQVRGYVVQDKAFSFDIAHNGVPSLIATRVEGPVSNFLMHADGQVAPGNTKALVKSITADATTDRGKAEAIFRFVVDDFEDWWYPAEGYEQVTRFPNNIGLQLWGYGYGFCSDSGQIAAALWREAGLKSRITKLHPFHTIASVKYDHAWHAYDLQHRTYWENADGSVASVDQLAADPGLFQQRLDDVGHDPIGYPPMLSARWYRQTEHRFHYTERWTLERDFTIDLRTDELFEVHHVAKPYIYHPDMWLQYYGESTLVNDPPWPLRGMYLYRPKRANYEETLLNDGRQAYLIPMHSPYVFTEGWVSLPGQDEDTQVFVYAFDRLRFVGPMISGKARLGRHIAGTYSFAVCVVPATPWADPLQALSGLELRAYTQMGPLTQPTLRTGDNRWHIRYQSGQPIVTVWFREHGANLTVSPTELNSHPKPGEEVTLQYLVTNTGSGPSMPSELEVRNVTTALLSEANELVGRVQVPPLAPQGSALVSVIWIANTRMTWYGQNPLVQRFLAQLDRDKQQSDADRRDNSVQHYVRMADESGRPTELPGYSMIGLD